ncbi:hypothetical protein DPMN_003999 [Dreissena polymorpha]|uniref:Uncharacterized protein n=1 Tax=Dreissena polymorpha TaxID=45954 RepID=A0A9D4MM04_DREPO|nr:hypothetical protein DPMN_003999 [Dreissena polymorpha]
MATVRQYDGDNAIERWRHCDDTTATVRYDYRIVAPIIAEATVGNGFHGDIGLDDLLFTQSTCSLYLSMANTQSTATCPTTTISPGLTAPRVTQRIVQEVAAKWWAVTCEGRSGWFLGDCSVTCGDGILSRMRICSSGHDEDCPGSAFDTMACSQGPC